MGLCWQAAAPRIRGALFSSARWLLGRRAGKSARPCDKSYGPGSGGLARERCIKPMHSQRAMRWDGAFLRMFPVLCIENERNRWHYG